MIKICNKTIEYSFYLIFFLVPLALWSSTSELFELNKMWLTWGLTIIIGTAWFTKMILERRIIFQKTLLDIPILLFLISQIISTIFSLDVHVSIWGYYSRFNGGLLSIISYIFLYYAFLSNSPSVAKVQRLMTISLISGFIVALWGLPSHFGYDPTCLLFRGNFDVSCWTADFQPRVRIFSTLGQPNWLAAYLAIIIPISLAFAIQNSKRFILNAIYLILYTLFLLAFFYSRSQSGFLGIIAGLFIFFGIYIWQTRKQFSNLAIQQFRPIGISILLFLLAMFIAKAPIQSLNNFSYEILMNKLTAKPQVQQQKPEEKTKSPTVNTPGPALEGNITESGKIRSVVWKGALEAWKNNPLFGTGVETFAFAYYKYKSPEHNLTSEWNFLYNKAHNEYLNYLATTGIFGLGSYLLMIGLFLTIVILKLKTEGSQILRSAQNDKTNNTLTLALLSGYIATLIIHFFGFSVVISNLYLFLIPAFVFVLNNSLSPSNLFAFPKAASNDKHETSGIGWTGIVFLLVTACYLLFALFNSWNADKVYALGYNLDRAGQYQQAYSYLHKAVSIRGWEPTFKDALSVNDAILAAAALSQKDKNKDAAAIAASLAQEALATSDEVISQHPNNMIFWKSRVRVFYTLAQVDGRYLPKALEAVKSASLLAPQDANIFYNLGVLYGQNRDFQNAIKTLQKTILLKPDYKDAHYALGLFYRETKENEKAVEQMNYILNHIAPNDPAVKETLKSWGVL